MSATQQLILLIEDLFGDDQSHKSTLDAIKAELATDEAEMVDLKAQLAALPAAFDPTALEGRVAALEARNAADDAAAGAAPNPDAPPVSVITLGPATLPDPVVGQPYTASISASGSSALPFSFSIASGSLPDGLIMGAGGGITGTPTTAGQSDVTIQAHDANNDVGSVAYTLTVDVAPPATVAEPEPAAPATGA